MRIVFMGSPDFALPALRRLIESEHEVVAVYTQPDRPVGRGRKLAPPPVKALAEQHRLPIYQPKTISRPACVEELRALAPDAGVIAAYGQILKQPVLDVPRLGVLNVHASLLPRWRGAAPIPAAILAGDEETGATIMKVRLELDAGPMLASTRTKILAGDTTATLTKRIAEDGAGLLMDVLPRYASGGLPPVEQDASLATYAPRLRKADALIDWERETAEQVWRKVRAYNPWPVAHGYLGGRPLRILECIPMEHRTDAAPGTICTYAGVEETQQPGAGFSIVTARGDLGVIMVQGAGGKAMTAAAYLRGHREIAGKRLRSGAPASD